MKNRVTPSTKVGKVKKEKFPPTFVGGEGLIIKLLSSRLVIAIYFYFKTPKNSTMVF